MNRLRTTRTLLNLRQGRTDWYKIKAQAGTATQVMIFDEIGYFGVTAQDFVSDLLAVEGDLDVHINSPGGEIFDGIAIYNALKSRGGVVTITVDALAASIASVIAMAASPGRLTMAKNSTMMIHNGFGMCLGDADDMRQLAAVLDKQTANIASIYAERSGKSADHFLDLMKAETWLSAQEAVDEGLADQVGSSSKDAQLSDRWDLSVFAHAPARLRAQGGHDASDHPGQECWDPDDDGDCDLSPEGDTDHDYWSADGEQLKPVPGKPMSQDHLGRYFRNAWDGPAAMSRASNAKNPEAAFRSICAGEKTVGEPDTQAHWALPHHDNQGDPPNPDGVSAALGRLNQTHDLKDPAAARRHLEAHQSGEGSTDNHMHEGADDYSIDPAIFRSALRGLA